MYTKPVMVRQGDVLLVPVYRVPPSATAATRTGDLVLAEGEATGHAHVLAGPDVREFSTFVGLRFVVTTSPARLTHEEHAPIDIAPGAYEVVIQREYDAPASISQQSWGLDRWKRVVD